MKNEFIRVYREKIHREGSDRLLDWLENESDFFTAPASTRFHLSCPGGLVEHSLNVYRRLHEIYCHEAAKESSAPLVLSEDEEETIAICALLHDVCKANFYKVEMRNRKNERGQWEKYPFYVVEDQLPYGHGEKSVYIVRSFMKLSLKEAMAIRWHMGYSDTDFQGGGHHVGNAFDQYPLALMTHIADMMATHMDEYQSEGV